MRFVPLVRLVEACKWWTRRRELKTIRRKVAKVSNTRRVEFDPFWMQLEFHPEEPKRPWRTLCPHKFRNGVFSFIVPAGFPTDLASVPGWLLWVFSPFGRHQRAGLFHDAAYLAQICSRATADQLFRAIMREDGVNWLSRNAMYAAVRIFGGKVWSSRTEASVEEYRSLFLVETKEDQPQ